MKTFFEESNFFATKETQISKKSRKGREVKNETKNFNIKIELKTTKLYGKRSTVPNYRYHKSNLSSGNKWTTLSLVWTER